MKCYSATCDNMDWMDLEGVMLSEVSQRNSSTI